MRRNVLIASVRRLLDPDEVLHDAALMWVRHSFSYGYAALSFVALVIVTILSGFEGWPLRLGVGAAGAAIAFTATTEYRILALTSKGLVLMRAGRVRQVARRIIERPPSRIAMEPVGGTMLTVDWQIDGVVYTLTKAGQNPIERINRGR